MGPPVSQFRARSLATLTPRRLQRRQRVAVTAAVVVLGVATNLIATALCLLWSYAGYGVSRSALVSHGGHVFITRHDSDVGKSVYLWETLDPQNPLALRHVTPPSWARLNDTVAATLVAGPPGKRSHAAIAYGWPMLSFQGGVTRIPGAPRLWNPQFAPELPAKRTISSGRGRTVGVPPEPRTVPLEPIVPGAIVNTAIYTAWWAALFGAASRRDLVLFGRERTRRS